MNDNLMSNKISSIILCDGITTMKLKLLIIYDVDYVHIEFVLMKEDVLFLICNLNYIQRSKV